MQIRQLGQVDYLPTYEAMQAFTEGRTPETPDELWLCEHPPTYKPRPLPTQYADLLYTGRSLPGDEAFQWGLFNRLHEPEVLLDEALAFARQIAEGPTFAHGMTKKMLQQEWAMGLEQAIEAEAQAQAICMQTRDYARAYEAFVGKSRPAFEGD